MKRGIFILLFLMILVTPVLIYAADETEDEQVDLAYQCLEERINESCPSSLDDNIFLLLATGECRDEVIDESDNEECWPASDCRVKTTAQAILALQNDGYSTDDAEEWLIAKNTTPANIVWYLEIESDEETTCTVSYSDLEYTISIGEDKKINSGAGSCLSLSDGSWWLEISTSCYDKEFEISCDQDFLTTLLFQKQDSSTIHISDEVSYNSAYGTSEEKVTSFCFADSGTCNYEGSLWAVFVLNLLDYEIDPYLPYLITEADENQEYLPESFLYMLTGSSDYKNTLLSYQKTNHWDESGDELYDTAVALYPFQYDESSEKTLSIEWLLDEQDNDGCWETTKNTAFILHSVWQRTFTKYNGVTDDEDDCEDSGYFCMAEAKCIEAGGAELDFDGCTTPNICCSKEAEVETCAEQGGEICASDEDCISGTEVDASDVDYGEQCCVDGYCSSEGTTEDESDCETYGGTCRISCNEGEEETYSYTCDYGDSCCIKSDDNGGSYWWIWLLLILIVLLVVAIIFRDRLKFYFDKFKSKFSKGKSPPPGNRGIPMVSPTPMRPIQGHSIQRRIMHPLSHRKPLQRIPKKSSSDLDDVLKKLKEMSK